MKQSTAYDNKRKDRPASTPEAREQQLIAKAELLAEKKLEDGTASSMIIKHYLDLATERERLRRKEVEADIALKEAKIKAIESAAKIESLMEDAMKMFKIYHGDDEDA